MMDNVTKGKIGEAAAIAYLEQRGYRVRDVNWTNWLGELDIVAEDGDTLVFAEVKARASNRYGRPGEAVDYRKQRKLSMMAAQYIKTKRLIGKRARFDVIEITGGALNHIENAFESQISF